MNRSTMATLSTYNTWIKQNRLQEEGKQKQTKPVLFLRTEQRRHGINTITLQHDG